MVKIANASMASMVGEKWFGHTIKETNRMEASPLRPEPEETLRVSSNRTLETPTSHVSSILARMPKAELHVHADGCLRVTTILDLAQQQGITLPVPPEDLPLACVAPSDCPSLAVYLDRYVIPLMVLQTPEALERMVYELCEDARRENVRYLEPRFAPGLHQRSGLRLGEIVGAALRGWQAGRQDFGLEGGLILCAMRHHPPEENLAMARAGERYLGQGVVGFDLAGDEAAYPILEHREALLYARSAGYGMTAHAGEAAGAQSVRDAVEVIGVSRVGHGVRAREDPDLLPVLRDRGITLDMCPTSNVQTKAVPSLAAHPIRYYYDRSIRVTVGTDARTTSDTTVTEEMLRINQALGFRMPELQHITRMALEAGFADASTRVRLAREYEMEMAALLAELDGSA
jgi:adenosine deaminase